jgi:protein TonB
MIATEQNLQKGDRVEAARIFALLERIDKNAPSLPRLRDTMQKEAAVEMKAQQDAAKKAEDLVAKQAEAAKAAAAAAAAQRASATAAPQPPPEPVRQQPVTRPAPPPAPVQQTQAQESPPPPPVQAPKPARPAGLPSVVSSVQPDYPRQALRDSISGEVTIAFTVNADGSVGAANVVSSNPRGVFDRAALDAIRKWRFAPPGEPVTGRRTFSFTPGQ